MADSNPDERLTLKIDHFLYRASCVLASLERMYAAEGASVSLVRAYIQQIKFPADRKIALSVEPLFEVYAQIPAALSQIVNMQNQLLPILQGIFKIKGSVPSSLREAMKKGLEKYGFDRSTSTLIANYWKNSGRLIRDLRDLNEHFIALVDQTFFKHVQDPGQILVLLPDNPEEKSTDKFIYEKELDAFETIGNGLIQLSALVETILSTLNIHGKQFEPSSLYLGHMGSLEERQERTLGLMINITKTEETTAGRRLHLDTIEIQQIIPKSDGAGNIAFRKLKPDQEVFKE